uniref:Zinc finger CCCH-type, RNA binding motif and serine/arginine rich 2 n=1 Tax=Oreochromis niloticus TaxID=8128 RepID=I3IUK3_ORENI
RKERRKRKRQALAHAREHGITFCCTCWMCLILCLFTFRQHLHEEWLERERIAQEEFRLRLEKEETARKRKEEEERMIKEEWEAQQRREQEEKEQKQQEKRDREFIYCSWPVLQLENGGPWMNPEAPVTVSSENFGTERDVANCPFFLKTGACRFGDRCSRKHTYPTTSPTLMIRGMFRTFGMEESRRDDYDIDACLEHSEEEMQESFLEFYHDVLPEFKSVGKVLQFKVSCNYEPHLRGNVYVQENISFFESLSLQRGAMQRDITCYTCLACLFFFSGLFDRHRCPKGKHCNFLHVFRNPGNEFWEADRDLHMSPDRSVRGSHRDGWYSSRSWRQRHYSRSPVRSERSERRRDEDRRRSRSRERRPSHQNREDTRSSRSRHSDRWKDRRRSRSRGRSRSRSRGRSRSRSRGRSRSRSRDDEQDRRRNRSRDREKEHRGRDQERDGRGTNDDAHMGTREKSRSRERSPRSPDKSKKKCNDDSSTHRRHKHSKKSKKKSKKKHKKKSHLPEETASSGESEKEESGEETVENFSTSSPGGERNEMERTQKNSDTDDC